MPRGRGEPWRRPLGAIPLGDGTVEFRVWAPRVTRIEVQLRGRRHGLEPVGDGVYERTLEGGHGDDYLLVLDEELELPDPCSRSQPHGPLGPSRIVDPGTFAWGDDAWTPPGVDALILYELHVGTFSPEGTSAGVIPRLAGLRELGVTAVELMPVTAFPGERGWGYDPICLFAPHRAYGGPEGLARLVDEAHRVGIAVILDLVHNHLGPGAGYLDAFGPYLAHGRPTAWGPTLDWDGEDSGPVREWALQSACQWVRDYHVDGVRLDAVWAIEDESPVHLVAELAQRLHACSEHPVIVTAEADPADSRLRHNRLSWGVDAWWADGFHHALHALVTGERHGFYSGLGSVDDLARAFERSQQPPLVACAQNHDQVGNRPLGDRLEPAVGRVAAFCLLFSPYVPLLFMGEEHSERSPFPFFSDHADPAAGEATRSGRRRELREQGFAEEPLDPQSLETFAAARLRPAAGDPATTRLYRELIALRERLPRDDIRATAESSLLRVRRGEYELLCNFGEEAVGASTDRHDLALHTGQVELHPKGVRLPPRSAAIVR